MLVANNEGNLYFIFHQIWITCKSKKKKQLKFYSSSKFVVQLTLDYRRNLSRLKVNSRSRFPQKKENKVKIWNLRTIEFQYSLFLGITTLLSWLKSTLLLKNLVQIFIWKHNVYKQMRCSIIRKENAWEVRGGVGKE